MMMAVSPTDLWMGSIFLMKVLHFTPASDISKLTSPLANGSDCVTAHSMHEILLFICFHKIQEGKVHQTSITLACSVTS